MENTPAPPKIRSSEILSDDQRELVAKFLGKTTHWRYKIMNNGLVMPQRDIWAKVSYHYFSKKKGQLTDMPDRICVQLTPHLSFQVDLGKSGCWSVQGFPETLKIFVHTTETLQKRTLLGKREIEVPKLIDVTNEAGEWNRFVKNFIDKLLTWDEDKLHQLAEMKDTTEFDVSLAHAIMEVESIG